jgi:hypothetical protein
MKQSIVTRVIVAIVIVVFVAGTWVQSGQFDLGWLKFFSAAVLVATVTLTIWDLWLWKTRLAQLVPGAPRYIVGTWQGTLTSFWVNPSTGMRPAPKTAYLVVRQTATLVSIKLLTDESRSSSTLAAISTVDGTSELTYLYLNRPDARFEDRSHMHHGSTALVLSGQPVHRLRGRYWTDRDTKGELDFTLRNRKIVDDFDEAGNLFP